ncbi:MAG: hypothetical protein V4649_19385 [Bacteroidota bacterium]
MFNETDTSTEHTELVYTCAEKPKGTTRNRKADTKPKATKRFRHVYVPAHDLGRSVGLEVTFIAGGFTKDEAPNMDSLAAGLAPVVKYRATKDCPKRIVKLFGTFHRDPACVEVSTAKIKTRKDFRAVTTRLHTVARGLGMVGHTDWHGGGGGHIHVGMTGLATSAWDNFTRFKESAETKALLLDATNRPYINWAFGNPGDTDNTKSTYTTLHSRLAVKKATREQLVDRVEREAANLAAHKDNLARWAQLYRDSSHAVRLRTTDYAAGRAYVMEQLRYDESRGVIRAYKTYIAARKALAAYVEPEPVTVDKNKAYEVLLTTMAKEYGITPRGYGTIEFRIFQAPNNAAEHELHLDFALAYVEWAAAQAKAGKFAVPSMAEQIGEWTYEQAAKKFLDFVSMIGLDRSKYKRFLKNLARRFELVALGKTKLA